MKSSSSSMLNSSGGSSSMLSMKLRPRGAGRSSGSPRRRPPGEAGGLGGVEGAGGSEGNGGGGGDGSGGSGLGGGGAKPLLALAGEAAAVLAAAPEVMAVGPVEAWERVATSVMVVVMVEEASLVVVGYTLRPAPAELEVGLWVAEEKALVGWAMEAVEGWALGLAAGMVVGMGVG
eukprot:CAMPEP_0174721574 /NCGR_PEP_ID=MMETSP1094-20130205/36560_1 /TAXON_ID=156173 /ORGANISM="Chrysochromulina brevifilum, Strain UTEX LB 985" /LENGTH=175 /DNA_ID=CAMNT_0015922289 /DNA_START=294 /DNA_END=818 /DNA_ORIENTATION=-